MSNHQVTAIRLSINGTKQEHITHLQLDNFLTITRAEAVRLVDNGNVLFTKNSLGIPTYVESVHLRFLLTEADVSYVRTKSNTITGDNLLKLPRF